MFSKYLPWLGMLLVISLSAQNPIKFHFASIANLAEQEVAAKIVVPIFKSAGFDIDVQPMPAERARFETVSGGKDGDLLRIYSFGEKNPSLIRVPTPYSTVETTAFAHKSKNIAIKTREDLIRYKLVIVRGVQTTRDLTQGMPNVYEVTRLEQAIKLVQNGSYDIVITSDIGALTILKQLKINDIVSVGNISSLPLYLYFHPKHKDVVPKIDTVIQKMGATGELKKLRAVYEKELLEGIK